MGALDRRWPDSIAASAENIGTGGDSGRNLRSARRPCKRCGPLSGGTALQPMESSLVASPWPAEKNQRFFILTTVPPQNLASKFKSCTNGGQGKNAYNACKK
jgi:hypothetical protein